jgi:hypothetical protein
MAADKTVKFTLDVVTVTQREVDLPARCPGCGADLSASAALAVGGWMGVTQNAHLDEHSGFEWDEAYKDHAELQYNDEVQCRQCDMALAGPE